MRDVQAERDPRGKLIHKVGVRNVKIYVQYEEVLLEAVISSYVTLPSFNKGVHMSRFVEVVAGPPLKINKPVAYLHRRLEKLLYVHKATEAFFKIRTTLPFEAKAPVSLKSFERHISCELRGEVIKGSFKYFVRIKMPVTSLCPCSKAISDYGAHNQRAIINAEIQITDSIDLNSFMRELSISGSAPIYELLKRPDEKFVTEQAYNHPKFCEDIARDVSLMLDKKTFVINYSVVVESEESIHDHNALAIIDYFKFD